MWTYLLDTHAYLWLINGAAQLPSSIRRLVREPDTSCYLSIASCWEMAVKIGMGRLPGYEVLDDALDPRVIGIVVDILPVERAHAQALSLLKQHPKHRDPFDRMIAAQALHENLTLLSVDQKLDFYGVRRVWDDGNLSGSTSL